MKQETSQTNPGNVIVTAGVVLNAIILKSAYTSAAHSYWPLLITVPLLGAAIYDSVRHKFPRSHRAEKRRSQQLTGQLMNE